MMGRKACYDSNDEINKGSWTQDEDLRLTQFVRSHGEGCWSALAKKAGLKRCGKSCRFRWVNYLRPNLKRGKFSPEEDDLIIRLHKLLGNRWSLIAGRIPGRTDNEVKNYWNTRLSKKARLSCRRPTEPNSKEPAVSIIPATSAEQEGERGNIIYYPVIEDQNKGPISSNYPTKQEPSSCSYSRQIAGVSGDIDLWNPLQLNFNIFPSWASNFLHDDSNSAFVPKPIVYNQENAHSLSCMFDTENMWQDYMDHQMYSIPYHSPPFPEVGARSDALTVTPHMDEFADIFNHFQKLY
eukprot:PITA_10585